MGQYRLSIYGDWQIGLLIEVNSVEVTISLPFMTIHIGTTKYASGVFIFGHYFK